jgi:hypothetical protein
MPHKQAAQREKEQYARELFEEATREAAASSEWQLPVVMGIEVLTAVVAQLQLALRHPGNKGRSREIVREVVDQVIGRLEQEGFMATAELLRLGDNPEFDGEGVG